MSRIPHISNNDSSLICKDLLLCSLSPNIAIVASQSADDFVSTSFPHDSFYHLIRPFGAQLTSNFNIKNTQLITNTYKFFPIRFSRSVVDVLMVQLNERDHGESGAKKRKNAQYELFRIGELNKVMESHVKEVNEQIKELVRDSNEGASGGEEEEDEEKKRRRFEVNNSKIKVLKSSLYLKFMSRVFSSQLILPFDTFNHPIIHLIVLTSQDSVETINDILFNNNLNRKKHLILSPELRQPNVFGAVANGVPQGGVTSGPGTGSTANGGVTTGIQEGSDVPQVDIPNYLDLSSDDDSLICFLILVDETVPGDEAKCKELKSYIKKNFYYPCLSLKLNSEDPEPASSQNDDKYGEELVKPGIYKSVREDLENIQFNHGKKNIKSETQDSQDLSNKPEKLSQLDLSNIKNMLIELVKLNLIPFMEKKISYWDDLYIQPRKSITNRFFSASKRYFSSSSSLTPSTRPSFFGSSSHSGAASGAGGVATGVGRGSTNAFDNTMGYYRHNSAELIVRKLADWAFMLKDYKYAYATYDMLKKDFNQEKAWTYYASCQEMAAYSLLFEIITDPANIINQRSNASAGYYHHYLSSIKHKLETLFQIIDSANYTFLSRCNLRSFVLRFQLSISELFNCLKTNTVLLDSSGAPGVSFASSGGSLYANSIHSIKYLNEIVSMKLLNYTTVESPSIGGVVTASNAKKPVMEEKSYYLLKALIMERISYSYGIFLFNHANYGLLLNQNLITNPEDATASVNAATTISKHHKNPKDQHVLIFKKEDKKGSENSSSTSLTEDENGEIKNPYKLEKTNLAVMGLTRYRKAGLWLLLSSNQWEHVRDSVQLKLNIDKAIESVYGYNRPQLSQDNAEQEKREGGTLFDDKAWLHRADGLLGRFIASCDANLNIYEDKGLRGDAERDETKLGLDVVSEGEAHETEKSHVEHIEQSCPSLDS